MKFNVAKSVALYKMYNRKRFDLFGNLQGDLPFNSGPVKKFAALAAMQVPGPDGVGLRDKWGRQVLMMRPRLIDYSKVDPSDVLRHMWTLMDFLLKNEETQRKGIVIINEATNVARKNFSRDTIKLVLDAIQNAIPIRMAGFYICNAGLMFRIIFPIIKVFMKEKLRKRFMIIGSNHQLLNSYFPPASIPAELGGTFEHDHYAWLMARGVTGIGREDIGDYGPGYSGVDVDGAAEAAAFQAEQEEAAAPTKAAKVVAL